MMENNEVYGILKEWRCEELMERFERNCITTLKQFQKLSPELIKELIPEIGLRLNFIEQFENFEVMNSSVVFAADQGGADDDISVNSSLNMSVTSESSLAACSDDSTSTLYVRFDEDSLFSVKEAVVGLTEQQIKETPAGQYKQSCAIKSNLKDLLLKTLKGRSILNHYEVHKNLNSYARDELVEIIIDNELNNNADARIPMERFRILSNAIEGLFPKECAAVYFTSMRTGSKYKTGTGKLFRKYYNTRRRLKSYGLIKSKSSPISTGSSATEVFEEKTVELASWLENSKEPWNIVAEYWEETWCFRKRLLENIQTGDYYKKYPALQEPLGYTLLEADFSRLYPNAASLFVAFKRFAEKILVCAKKQDSKLINEKIAGFTNTDYESKETSLKLLLLLPYLVKPVPVKKGKTRGKTGLWKPSKLEVEEGFIVYVKSASDIEPALEQKRNKLLSLGLTLQPIPVIVGNDYHSEQCFVVVDKCMYEVSTPLKAVDVCFKIIHAVHALYSIEAEQIWLILQKAVYNIDTCWDKNYVAVNNIVSQLNHSGESD